MELRCATFNIRNTTDRYKERRLFLKDCISAVSFDICGLQEVRFESTSCCLYGDQRTELMQFDSNIVVYSTKLLQPFEKVEDSSFRIDGNCIAINSKSVIVVSHVDITVSNCRSAQRILFRLNNGSGELYSFTNVHLHHVIGDEGEMIRVDQVRTVLRWIHSLDTDEQVNVSLLAGDFNAAPSGPAYNVILDSGYVSTYKVLHSAEPEYTFPTGLYADTMDTDPKITCDYIFYKSFSKDKIAVVDVRLFGNVALEMDSSIYPSDHIGIVSTLLL